MVSSESSTCWSLWKFVGTTGLSHGDVLGKSATCHVVVVDVDHETGMSRGSFWGFKPSRHVEMVWKNPVTSPRQTHLHHLGTSMTWHDKRTMAHRGLVMWRNGEVVDFLVACHEEYTGKLATSVTRYQKSRDIADKSTGMSRSLVTCHSSQGSWRNGIQRCYSPDGRVNPSEIGYSPDGPLTKLIKQKCPNTSHM